MDEKIILFDDSEITIYKKPKSTLIRCMFKMTDKPNDIQKSYIDMKLLETMMNELKKRVNIVWRKKKLAYAVFARREHDKEISDTKVDGNC